MALDLMALGASPFSIVRDFAARGLRLGAAGVALGTTATLGLTELLGHVLFGVSSADGVSFARALAAVLGGVLAATLIPAARAARTSPLAALRHH
jgi:ABC-type lipoprotein release transport system permease subunit